jgi:phosphatidylserine decarboxylase
MAKTLKEWLDSDVKTVKDRSIRWLSENYFFRDPTRPQFSDASYFFAPADGTILYQKVVDPDECVIEIKGKNYTLHDAMQDQSYSKRSLVIGIFMSFYDVHINRIPLAGFLSYRSLDPITSRNLPMLGLEKKLVDEYRIVPQQAEYLFYNERMLNSIFAPEIKQSYYVIQIADYDIRVILPYTIEQHQPFHQNQRFSQIRYGSQVDLIIPLTADYDFECVHSESMHVEAGLDTLVRIHKK